MINTRTKILATALLSSVSFYAFAQDRAGNTNWPATGDIVISNGGSAPAGLATGITSGQCVVTLSGNFTVGSCASGNGTGSVTNINGVGLVTTVGGFPITTTGNLTLAQVGNNTVLGNFGNATGNVTAIGVPSCANTAGNHLNYTTGVGLSCGASTSGVTSVGTTGGLTGGPITSAGNISIAVNGVALTNIAQIGSNSVLGNNGNATGSVTALTVPNCTANTTALQYGNGTGFTCGNIAGGGNGTGTVTSVGTLGLLTGGPITGIGNISINTVASNTVLANTGNATGNLAAVAVPNCNGNGSGLQYGNGTGFACANLSGSGTVTFVGTGSGLSGGNFSTAGNISLAQIGSNSVLGNSGNTTGNPVALAVPACSGSSNALQWGNGTGFTCGSLAGNSTTGNVSVTASSASISISPSPGTGTFTIGTTQAFDQQSGTTYTVLTGDNTKYIVLSNAGNVAVTLPQAGSGGFATGWTGIVANTGNSTGVDKITTTTSTLLGGNQTLSLVAAQGAMIASDGTNWQGILGLPPLTGNTSNYLRADGVWAPSGTVTSVATSGGLTGGPITSSGTISIAANGVALTNIAQIGSKTVLGNSGGGTANVAAITPSAVLDMIDNTQGDILYRGASSWVQLAPGTSGQFLQTQGAAANPQWATGLIASNNLSDLLNAGTGRGNLGLGTVATQNTGTSGANIPFLNGANVFSGATTFSSSVILTNNAGPIGTQDAGYRGAPLNTQNGNYTLALNDAGATIYHSSGTAHTWTVPPNSSVAFPIGTAIVLVEDGVGNITVSPGAGVTQILAGNATTGARTMTQFGEATELKVGTDEWYLSGVAQ